MVYRSVVLYSFKDYCLLLVRNYSSPLQYTYIYIYIYIKAYTLFSYSRLLRHCPPNIVSISIYDAITITQNITPKKDQFQKDFFLIRQAEYLPYTNALGPGLVKQGQLDDPLYFDFISFAQYAAISRDITQNPQVVFEELQPEEEFTKNGTFIQQRFVTNVVRRDSSLMDNNLLPIRFDEIVGGKIIDRIIGETPSAFPSSITDGSKPNVNVVLLSMKQLVKTFLGYGFAFSGKVEMTPSSNGAAPGTEFVITLSAPATLWSGRALQQRKAKPCNDFILKASKVLLKKAGYGKVSTSLKYTNAQEISTIVLR